ncbi:TPA: type I Wadjet antiplasmid transformation system protein JetD [Bacillus cereus]
MDYKSKILSVLLNKFENSKTVHTGERSAQRPQFSFRQKHELSKAYNDEMDYTNRLEINTALKDLLSKGIIEVKWEKWEENRIAEKVYLQYDFIPQAYSEAGIEPKFEKMNRILKVLEPLAIHSWSWVQRWYKEVQQSFQNNKNARMDLNDVKGYELLVKALSRLEGLEDSIPKRTFSQLVFGDTKLFETTIQNRLLIIYKRYGDIEYESDKDYLESIGILENIQPVYVKGNVAICVRGEKIALGSFPGGIGLMDETIKELEIQYVHDESVMLIENMTTYYEQIKKNNNILFIYTGGFPKKNVQQLLKKLNVHLKKYPISVYHYGDLDYGGIQIFEYIKRSFFKELEPYMMDVSTYRQYVKHGMEFSKEYEEKLMRMLENERYSLWHELIKEMLKEKKRVEQEVIII